MSDTNKPLEYKDCLGNPIQVGNFVAYAVGSKYSDLNIAIVDQLTVMKGKKWGTYDKQVFAIKVRVYKSSGRYDPNTKQYINDIHCYRGASTSNFNKMIVVDRVPKEIAEFLRSGEREQKFGNTAKAIGDIDSLVDSL